MKTYFLFSSFLLNLLCPQIQEIVSEYRCKLLDSASFVEIISADHIKKR